MNIEELAKQYKKDVKRLLKEIEKAGIGVKQPTDVLTAAQKVKLVEHMKSRKSSTLSLGKSSVKSAKSARTAAKNDRSASAAKRPTTNKTNPRELAKALAEQKRLEQAQAMRDNEDRLREENLAKEAEKAKREADKKNQKLKELEKEAEEKRLKAEREAAFQAQLLEQERRAKAEREAADKKNAQEELRKQKERDRQSKAERDELERQRQEALEDVRRREGYEEEAQSRFHIHAHDHFVSKNDRNKKGSRSGEDVKRNGFKAKRNKNNKVGGFKKPAAPIVREVRIPETITVSELAQKMSIKAGDLIKAMMKMGSMVTINQLLDQETAALVAEELGHSYVLINENMLEDELLASADKNSNEKQPRAPVVTIMGHVDHGKTSLLDYIRKTKVVAGEAGGITQHIGAYRVTTDNGVITFLDTPGHAAFTAMRARGASATDIVVLVVAADDGVMPQTKEAIEHANAANVPLIVAVNKIDKPDADLERVRSELSQYGVISEEWGGEHLFAHVSAKTGEGIPDLLEKILIQAEVLELSAYVDGPARGVVIESRVDRGRGVVATVLVQSGNLCKGSIMLAGMEYGKIRAMLNEDGKELREAGPSMPVEVLGLSGTPNAGDEVIVVESERKAREIANFRQGKFKEIKIARQQKAKLENLFSNVDEKSALVVNLMIKADVQGSVEALSDSLSKLSTSEVQVKIISAGIGGISESDAQLAIASGSIIIAFNVRPESNAKRLLEDEGVDLRYYSVIYQAINEVKDAMQGKLAPEIKEEIIGIARVKDVFRSSKLGAIAGCLVEDGMLKRSNPIRVLRENVVIYEGELESLRRFKDDVNEVRAGTECGLGVKNYNDVRVGDLIECYQRISVTRVLDGK